MDVPRLQALNRYHQQHPPLHLLAAAWLGFTGKPEPPPDNDLAAFATAFQGLGGAVS